MRRLHAFDGYFQAPSVLTSVSSARNHRPYLYLHNIQFQGLLPCLPMVPAGSRWARRRIAEEMPEQCWQVPLQPTVTRASCGICGKLVTRCSAGDTGNGGRGADTLSPPCVGSRSTYKKRVASHYQSATIPLASQVCFSLQQPNPHPTHILASISAHNGARTRSQRSEPWRPNRRLLGMALAGGLRRMALGDLCTRRPRLERSHHRRRQPSWTGRRHRPQ